ncbi:paired amphipathic helix protein Sin3-like 4 [Medicago truncatula]|uniref:Paired amphipathic helix protein n=2 Tax=Medicago truncatula TaxID=3880 RepID=G7IE24_MEDTR|nr:paired amphipathic helix protein Sin3-like 4 [Medicago truncatula]AES62694.1 paired amphipathic helix protein [Medicago truncatula]
MEFIKDVKVVLQDKKEKFDDFMKLLHDFRAKRIDRRVIKEGIMELLKEHQDLISRFNIFLPPGDEIPLLFPTSFATAVKVAFPYKMEKYDEFLKLVVDYNAKRIDMRVFKEGLMELFKDHKDLLLGLNTWLPEGHKISLPLDGDEQQGDDGLELKYELQVDEAAAALKDEEKDDEQ